LGDVGEQNAQGVATAERVGGVGARRCDRFGGAVVVE
jgi:hypothetical protein